MFAGKKSAQIREILISESAWEEMTCLFAPSLTYSNRFMSDWSWDKADYQVLLNNGFVVQYGASNIYHDTGMGERMIAAGQIMQQNTPVQTKPVQTNCHQVGTSVYCSSY